MPLIMMPALSPTMTEGKLAKWLVAVGDSVASGDVIAEIETDKAVMEVEALDDGVMASIAVAEGTEGVAVGAVIAEILDEGEESQMGAVPEKASDLSLEPTISEANNNEGADAKVVEATSAPLKAEASGGKFVGICSALTALFEFLLNPTAGVWSDDHGRQKMLRGRAWGFETS